MLISLHHFRGKRQRNLRYRINIAKNDVKVYKRNRRKIQSWSLIAKIKCFKVKRRAQLNGKIIPRESVWKWSKRWFNH